MKTIKKYIGKTPKPNEADFFVHFWEKSWTYIKTMVDVVREPVLILDEDLRVIAANESFYEMFLAKLKDTEGKVVYQLGNGQWDIPELKKLLENILPKDTFFKGFQVAHDFPKIGRKVMVLNARKIYVESEKGLEAFPSLIVLAMEDVTDMMVVAESLSNHAKMIEAKLTLRTRKMEALIGKLEKEIIQIKKPKKSKKSKSK